MTSLLRIVIAAGLSGAVFAAPALAQARQAVPRGAVSRGDGGGSRGDGGGSRGDGGGSRGAVSRGDGGGSRGGEARAPQRDSPRAESPRPESPRAETPRASAPERSRGTDDAGRVRVPPARRDEDRGERTGFARPAPVDRGDRGTTTRVAGSAPNPPTIVQSDTPSSTPAATPSTVVPRWPTPNGETRRSDGGAAATTTANDEEQRRGGDGRQAVPRGSRPRGDNPAIGRAVPRDGGRDGGVVRGGGGGGNRGGRGVYIAPRGRTTYNYYYYPRRYYPYGYGAFGLGYFYYDPYAWGYYDPFGYRSYRYYGGGHYGGYGGGYYGGSQYGGYYTGELRLRVTPRHAEVYVDGYFAGHVDDFDGILQGLRLEEGPYRIEIVAPGYEPLEFDIRIQPGRKITYRADLRPRP